MARIGDSLDFQFVAPNLHTASMRPEHSSLAEVSGFAGSLGTGGGNWEG